MNNRFLQSLQLYLALLDFAVINIVFFVIQFIFRIESLIGNEVEYVYFGFFISVIWLIVVLLLNVYNEKNIRSFEVFSKISFKAYIYFLFIAVVYLFFLRMTVLSRVFVTIVLSCIPIALLINRFIYLFLNQYLKKKHWLISKVLVIGYNDLSKKLVSYLEEDSINKEIVGYCEEYNNVQELSHYPILSGVKDAIQVCKEHYVTEIYSTIAPEHNQFIYQLIQSADQNCIRFKIVPDLGFFFNKQMHIDHLKEIPVLMLRREPLEDLGNHIKKRIIDIAISSFVIVFFLSWMIPLIGLFIILESKGSIFFKQLRTGKDNKNFWCLKFRSMHMNNDAETRQATKNDDRKTRIGNFLRKTSLDEFPQFINVLCGQMSLVGPRPHMLHHTNQYSKLIGKYMVRQFLKPGITGWAQVNGFRGETQTLEQMQFRVEHDLWYMENWSIMLDIRIMFMTVINIFKGENNAA